MVGPRLVQGRPVIATRCDRYSSHVQGRAAGDIRRCVPDNDNIPRPEVNAGQLLRALYGNGRQETNTNRR